MNENHDLDRADDKSRRAFLKDTAHGLGWLVIVGGSAATISAIVGDARAEEPAEGEKQPADEAKAPPKKAPEPKDDFPHDYDPKAHNYIYLIDISKCIGCGSCVRACEMENDVPQNYFRTWVERYLISRTGEVEVDSPNGSRDGFKQTVTGYEITKAFFVPKICNHCTMTPCVQLCPVGASYRSPDGLILVDEKRCIGCSYCVQACPYGSRFIHPETHTASKCTFCYHRITRGMQTACVQACPVGARKFGDTKMLHDEVSEIIATKKVHVLKPELLTEPNCYYLGLTREVT